MRKQEFLNRLAGGLSGLPRDDVAQRLAFYSEIIDDRMEEGLSEEEAVQELGSVEEIVSQILEEVPFAGQVKVKVEVKKKWQLWEILLLVLGSPVWFPLLIAAVAVVMSLYISIWSVIVALWAVFGAMIGCTVCGVILGIIFAVSEHGLTGVALLGAGLVCCGLSIFLFWGCRAVTKGTIWLTKRSILGIKGSFIRKEEV